MFADYQSCVLEDYRKKKEVQDLSFNLQNPTPANLKMECVAVYNKGLSKKDGRILEKFFQREVDTNGYEKFIAQFDTERFKPLCNFLNGKTSDPKDINIELLAWLIDFQPRPYYSGWKAAVESGDVEILIDRSYRQGNDDNSGSIEQLKGQKDPSDGLIDDKHRKNNPPVIIPVGRKKITLFTGILFTGAIGCMIWFNNATPSECMYWTGDHYVPVACSERIHNKVIVALDTMKAAHFRRITRPDTITKKAKGHVWYCKFDGKIEYYTSDGVHPLYPDKELKKITDYMIDKHIK